MSFKIRAPLTIEAFDTYSFEVIGTTNTQYVDGQNKGDDHTFQLILIPKKNPQVNVPNGIDGLEEDSVDLEEDSVIQVYLGKQFQDYNRNLIDSFKEIDISTLPINIKLEILNNL